MGGEEGGREREWKAESGEENCFLSHRKYAASNPAPPPRTSGRGRPPKDRDSAPSHATAVEQPTEDLLKWQSAVAMVTSASQLAVLASQLDSCVTWEKSPTKVVRRGGGEGEREGERRES